MFSVNAPRGERPTAFASYFCIEAFRSTPPREETGPTGGARTGGQSVGCYLNNAKVERLENSPPGYWDALLLSAVLCETSSKNSAVLFSFLPGLLAHGPKHVLEDRDAHILSPQPVL
jgi:hypothetical protein